MNLEKDLAKIAGETETGAVHRAAEERREQVPPRDRQTEVLRYLGVCAAGPRDRVAGAAGSDARRSRRRRCRSIVEERQRSRRACAAATLWVHGGYGHLLRCSSSTMLQHRLLVAPRICTRKTRARGRAVLPRRLLEREIWPKVPSGLLGRGLTEEEQEGILGYGPEGV